MDASAMPTENTTVTSTEQQFAADVREGLRAREKYLPSKYLYNKRGDEIFQEIMAMPEYYLTRAEYEIFSSCKEDILAEFNQGGGKFHLIEFGAGDGMKTKILLQHFVSEQASFSYVPIDISSNILKELTQDLRQQLPALEVYPICDDYFKAIEQLNQSAVNGARKVVLFLGANIGNFDHAECIAFLQKIADHLSPGDRLMIGFDLKKDPSMILDAYFDKGGITRAFKLNLLERINTELGANFDLEAFQYFPIYDPMEGSIRSYLVSRKEQQVHIRAIDTTIYFEAWEAIYMERSQKFSLKNIEQLAEKAGFRVVHNFFDKQRYFTDSLWELKG